MEDPENFGEPGRGSDGDPGNGKPSGGQSAKATVRGAARKGLSNDDVGDGICCLFEAASDILPDTGCLAESAHSVPSGGCCFAEAASSFGVDGCFVATAALEPADPHNHPDLNALRAFRDQVLQCSAPGRFLTRTYYRWGRYPAVYIADKPLLKRCIRALLIRPFAAMARKCTRGT